MRDTVSILKFDGRRLGPFKATVSADSITIGEKAIDVDEGDHVLRPIPGDKEETYLILLVDYSEGLLSIPPSYTLKVRKTTALPTAHSAQKNTTINIHSSSGFQVGDYNTQNIQAAFTELIRKVEDSDAPPDQKSDAKRRLSAFLEHPLVTSLLGGAAGSLFQLLGGI
jgi:hypothetical protein